MEWVRGDGDGAAATVGGVGGSGGCGEGGNVATDCGGVQLRGGGGRIW